SYLYFGDTLEILPFTSAAGTYEVEYVPTCPPLFDPSITVNTSLDGANIGGVYTLSNADFTSAYVGATITIAGAFNSANNGTFNITSVTSPTVIVTDNASSVLESFGVGVTASSQPLGTINTLPQQVAMFDEYVMLFAAIAIVDKRQMDS